MQISNHLKKQYVNILLPLIKKRKRSFTQAEIAEILNISRPTYIAFENQKKIDFVLLDQLAGLVGEEILLYSHAMY